jgi:hypothetical protein
MSQFDVHYVQCARTLCARTKFHSHYKLLEANLVEFARIYEQNRQLNKRMIE